MNVHCQIPDVPRWGLTAAIVAASLALAPLPALAAPATPAADAPAEEYEEPTQDPDQARAIELYQLGTELYNDAKFEEALAAFEQAATLFASPDFQFNIAKCYERLGKYEQAIHHFETYLRTADDPPDRAVIETTIADLERRLALAETEVKATTTDTPIQAPLPPSGKPLVISGGVLLGVGVAAGLGGGLAFGLQVARDNSTLGDVLSTNPDELTFAEANEIADRARTNQTLELVMIGVGGAVALTGVVLLAVGLKRNKARAAAKAAAPAAAHIRVAPSWMPRGGGLFVQGSF